jgi:hypothetical protein
LREDIQLSPASFFRVHLWDLENRVCAGVVAARLQLRTQHSNLVPERQPTNILLPSPLEARLHHSISYQEHNNTDKAGDMSPMLDRFVEEPRRAGHFNSMWAKGFGRGHHLVGRQPGQYNAAPAQQQANEVQPMKQEHIGSQGQQVTISTVQEQDLAQVGAWTK